MRGQKAVTAEPALQLEATTGVSAETWMNLQTQYDLVQASAAAKKMGKAVQARPRA